jgi:hypothetical protein
MKIKYARIAAAALASLLLLPESRPRASAAALEHAAACAALPAAPGVAIQWSPVEIKCPLCGTTNTFLQWLSYGSYIYEDPSKYQLVFWPFTDSPVVYSCKQCRLTAFMGDFERTPKEKFAELRKVLAGVELPRRGGPANSPPGWEYTRIPMTARLLAAEKVYRVLGRTEDDFWGHFYRVLGYHHDVESDPKAAAEARRRALTIAERALADPANEGRRKELLYAAGAMRHFLGDDAGALRDFEAAAKLSYADKDLKPEEAKNADNFFSALIAEYVEKIKKGEHPRARKAGAGHEHR